MHRTQHAEPPRIDMYRDSGWYRAAGASPARSYGISTPLLYACIRLQTEQIGLLSEIEALRSEMRQLRRELQHTTDERDMLRNGHRVLATTLDAQRRKPQPGPETRRAARARVRNVPEMCAD